MVNLLHHQENGVSKHTPIDPVRFPVMALEQSAVGSFRKVVHNPLLVTILVNIAKDIRKVYKHVSNSYTLASLVIKTTLANFLHIFETVATPCVALER